MASFATSPKLLALKEKLAVGERNLRAIDLSNDNLDHFPLDLFEIKDTVEFINFGNNNLHELPSNICEFSKLRILFFAQNQFRSFPTQLSSLPNLYMLSFKSNFIEVIPENSLPSSLVWLILTDNKLKALPQSIGKLTKLRKLMLSGNQLERLPQELSCCKNIELIRLAVNCLQVLPLWLIDLPNLSWIAYSGNPLIRLHNEEYSNSITVSNTIDWSKINIVNLIGEGASGVVYKGNFADSEVAVKLYKGSITSDGVAEDEIMINEAVGTHDSFVPFLGRIVNHPEGKPGLLLQILDEGQYKVLGGPPSYETVTRDTFLDQLQFSVSFTLTIAKDIAAGCKHLHGRHILHGDLYAHNILANHDGRALLTDFGASSFTSGFGEGVAERLERIEVRAFGCLLEDLLSRTINDNPRIGEMLSQLRDKCVAHKILDRPSFSDVVNQLKDIEKLTY